MTTWTADHQTLLDLFAATFPPPIDDDACRDWTRRLAEQFAYEFGTNWGTKQADPGRPPSTDCICTASPFTGFDVLINQATSWQTVATNPPPLDLTGQVFIAVVPVDHLGLDDSTGTTPPPPTGLKDRETFYAELQELNRFYEAPQGLQRPGGMVITPASTGIVSADVEALGSWGYDLMLGATVAECKARIVQSDEWKSKHPDHPSSTP